MTATPALPQRDFSAFLFDMDGTILTSIKAAERVWGDWAASHGLDVAAFLPTIHGKRTEETIRALELPGVDPVAEAARITLAEIEDVAGIEAIEGAADFIASLPAGRWAIVTSAPRALAEARIAAAGLPSIVVTVTHAHPLETDAGLVLPTVLDYADLRAVTTADGLLRVQRRT